MYLSLPITKECKSIDDCMDLYLKEDVLKGADQYYCEKCKEHVDGTKKQDIWMLPPVLIVHLKRFKYNDYGKVGSKNDAAIRYPVTGWDLKSRVKSSRGVYPRYDLYAVSNHMGGLGGGHYTAHTLNRFDDVWYEFNDSSYRSVDDSIHKRLFKSSYVLFYNRSEGDANMPLNERSPLIRRQSVSRPDLWPHSQVDDPREVRNFTRSHVRRHHDPPAFDPPDFSPQRKATTPATSSLSPRPAAATGDIPANSNNGSSSSSYSPSGIEFLSSISEGTAKIPSFEFKPGENNFVPIKQMKTTAIHPNLDHRFDKLLNNRSAADGSTAMKTTRSPKRKEPKSFHPPPEQRPQRLVRRTNRMAKR